ncbi:response regulator [Desulfonauticus submarinus]|uniref:Response regulator receiver domain-containing protein n=1 Tax=Desulfonauticus submarinus TaxID=206665 RepID=A0A1H0FLD4_9BACT|nr:response regulator [Desulfonauticus submarinus]SDN95311.1 Response regulator receiver domain-containing protein [Desulfonauticus submarinus]
MSPKKKIKILLVDDEIEFLNSIAERINLRGFEAVTATSGEEALELVKKETFYAAVIDLKMPGLDGLETIKKLREQNPKLHTILLTGYGDEKVKEATLALESEYFDKADMPSFWDYLKRLAHRVEDTMAAAGLATHGDLEDAQKIEKGEE